MGVAGISASYQARSVSIEKPLSTTLLGRINNTVVVPSAEEEVKPSARVSHTRFQ